MCQFKEVISTSLFLSMISHGIRICIKYKSDIFEKFKEFKYEVEKQTKKILKVLRSDREGNIKVENFLIIS